MFNWSREVLSANKDQKFGFIIVLKSKVKKYTYDLVMTPKLSLSKGSKNEHRVLEIVWASDVHKVRRNHLMEKVGKACACVPNLFNLLF
jgi:hypothetical protein